MASFSKEVNPRLVKGPLKTNGHLANRGLTYLVKEATGVCTTKNIAKKLQICWKFSLLYFKKINLITTKFYTAHYMYGWYCWGYNKVLLKLFSIHRKACMINIWDIQNTSNLVIKIWIQSCNFLNLIYLPLEPGVAIVEVCLVNLISWGQWGRKLANAEPKGSVWMEYTQQNCAGIWMKEYAAVLYTWWNTTKRHNWCAHSNLKMFQWDVKATHFGQLLYSEYDYDISFNNLIHIYFQWMALMEDHERCTPPNAITCKSYWWLDAKGK